MQLKQFAKAGTGTYGYNVITSAGYNPAETDPAKQTWWLFFMHGIGQCSNGTLPEVNAVLNWTKTNSFLLDNVDKYNINLVIPTYLNTSTEKSKVAQWILQKIKSTHVVNPNKVAFIGHSNGSHLLGTWSYADPEFAKQAPIWIPSASGPFTTAATFKNCADNDVRIMGITALNDSVASSTYVTQLGTKIPAINPNALVVIYTLPATRFPDGEDAHNMVLGQITKSPLPFVSLPGITDRLGSAPKMDLYQFILSNPKGSVHQLPDKTYTGAIYDTDTTEPVPEVPPVVTPPPPPPVTPKIKRVNATAKKIAVTLQDTENKTAGSFADATQVDVVELRRNGVFVGVRVTIFGLDKAVWKIVEFKVS